MTEEQIRKIVREELEGTFGYVFSKDIQMLDGRKIQTGRTTGTKIGTGTDQKIGFWNTTPIIQPTTSHAEAAFTASTGTAVNDNTTFDNYTLRQVVKALRDIGLLT